MPSPSGTAELTGSVTYKGVAAKLGATIEGPAVLLSGGAAPASLSLAAEPLKLDARGKVAPTAPTAFEGDVSFTAASLDAVFDWLGIADAPRGLGAASLETRLFAGSKAVAAEGFKAAIAGSTLTGDASLNLFGGKPRIDARLVVDRLDLDRLQSLGGTASKPAAGGAPAATTKKSAGSAKSAGGSDAPIDLSGLDAVDAAVELDVGELVVAGSEARNVGLGVELIDRRLSASLFEAAALGGSLRGHLVADARARVPAFSGDVALAGLDLEEIGRLAARPLPASGNASLTMSFAARGATRAALAETLDGKGTLGLDGGRVAGLGLKDAVGGDPAADVVENISVRADFVSLAAPVKATGALTWRGERFDVAATLSPRSFIDKGRTDVALDVTSKRVAAGFSGNVAAGDKTALSGRVRLKTGSLRDLLAWVGQPIEAGAGLGAFSVEGVLEASPAAVAFSDAAIALDGSSGKGDVKVAFSGKPRVSGSLALATLDVNPYLGAELGGSAGKSGGKSTGGGAGGAGGAKAAAQPAPAKGGAWSNAPIDFSGLRAVDADLRLSADKILVGKMTIGKSALEVNLAGGILKANLARLSLYKGSGTGRLELDGTRERPNVAAVFDLTGLDAYPFLRDAAGFERIEGTGAISFDVTTAGASQRALVSGLAGKAAFAFNDGAVRGINIARLIRGVTTEVLLGWQENKTEKTDFASLTANYVIAKGIARNDDLRLIGPLVRLTGAGTVDLPAQTLSYRVEPMLVTSLKGQGGREDLQGMKVPVVIEGPWSNPRFYPDIAGILENPEAAFKQLRDLGGGLFAGQKTEEAVRTLIDKTSGGTGLDLEGLVRENGKIDEKKALDAAARALGNNLQKSLQKKKATAPAANTAKPSRSAPVPDVPINEDAIDLLQGLLGR
ncbi:MAG: AsmA family protein [Hyphomicrobiales bacterium]